MKSCPVELKPYEKAHQNRLQEQNMMLFLQGRYAADAIMATIGNSPWFKSKSAPIHKYPKEPYPLFENAPENMTEEEKQREVDKFFAQESARRANWKLLHGRRNHEAEGSQE
ncbi:MAG TPA: synembryn [Candidatus Acetatifactor stercoripullorum]|uniref:Synembryn n=1 Tax=Candidatus Acetatifactor stercoripullorum TaxID=2838414 RepID=A0A9D1R8W1_9FIRM|nr:synembryn [Candidatus Acetatifactor stercoripullorum]